MTTTDGTGLARRIRSQVEFYLGDANMPRDKFLKEQAARDADGWISVDTIASFQRMRALSSDVATIKAALVSGESQVFEVDAEGNNVRRKDPLLEMADLMPRSVYVRGFPQTATLDELLAFFRTSAENVEAVRMRRFPKSKDFKGSVFVEFASEQDAKTFLEDHPKKYQGTELWAMSKLEYFESKNKAGKEDVEVEFERLATEYTKGCLVKLSRVPKDSTHQQVKKAIAEITGCEIAFVEQQQDGAVFVRLKDPRAQDMVEALSKAGFKVNDSPVSAQVPTEEEEGSYYRNLAVVMISKKSSGKYRQKATGDRSLDRNNKKRLAGEDDLDEEGPESKESKDEQAGEEN